MPYHIEIDEALVLDYLSNQDRNLTDKDIGILLGVLEGLAHTGNIYRNDPAHRCSPGSQHFEVKYLFVVSAGRLRHFRFVVSDQDAVYGVLRVRFAEEL